MNFGSDEGFDEAMGVETGCIPEIDKRTTGELQTAFILDAMNHDRDTNRTLGLVRARRKDNGELCTLLMFKVGTRGDDGIECIALAVILGPQDGRKYDIVRK